MSEFLLSGQALTGREINARIHAVGILLGDQVEQLLMGALDLRNAEDQQARVRALSMMARDTAERTLHEAISLMNSVMHSDVASFTRQLEEFKVVQGAFSSSVQALATQYTETAAAQRELATLMREVIAGLRAEQRQHESSA